MKARTLYTLTCINLVMLAFIVVQQVQLAHAQSTPAMLRGQGLEIIDRQGRVRASIGIQPPSKGPAGEEYPETVLLRLITEKGRPTVKIQSTEPSSGLSFAGPTGTNNAYLILETKGIKSSLRLRNENGNEQFITP
jgi:hypothetical protein